MILFYSDFCQHCNVLLETIKRHDKNGIIKLVSIDDLRSLNKPIDKKIHSVPALLILNTKEYLFGKNVFDYLLLPNRGVLFSTQISSKGQTQEIGQSIGRKDVDINHTGEPSAFSLGSISSEYFSPLEDSTDSVLLDKNYNFDFITEDNSSIKNVNVNTNVNTTGDKIIDNSSEKKKDLPSLEEIMSRRANDIL